MDYKKFHLKRLKNELLNRNKLSDSSSNDYKYLDIVKSAVEDPVVYETFRNNPGYKDILEHIKKDLAYEYYKNLLKELSHEEIINYCSSIKNIGSPELVEINGASINPTSLRYLNVAIDIKNKFQNSSFENIVEIGAGYGGQAIILEKFFKIKNYYFIDLYDVNLLIKKFLNDHSLNFKAHFATLDSIENKKYDLIISNYAFSELPKNMQIDAINKIIKNSTNGYMLVNNFHKISFRYMSQKEYSKNIKNLKVHEEIPNSYLFNKLLTF